MWEIQIYDYVMKFLCLWLPVVLKVMSPFCCAQMVTRGLLLSLGNWPGVEGTVSSLVEHLYVRFNYLPVVMLNY